MRARTFLKPTGVPCRPAGWAALLVLAALAPGCARRTTPSASAPRVVEPGVTGQEVDLPGGDDSRKLWIYLPQNGGSAKRPCILIAPAGSTAFFGMKLGEGDRPEHLPYVRAGFAVVAYSLDGDANHSNSDRQIIAGTRAFVAAEGGLANARAALDYVLANVPTVDRSRIYAVGHSSAATMALVVAENEPRIRACVAFAPACDLQTRWGADAVRTLSAAVPGFSEFIPRASPIEGAGRLRCPLFLFHADDDTTVPHSDVARFANAVARTNPRVTFVRVAQGGHYDSMLHSGIPKAIQWLGGATSASAR